MQEEFQLRGRSSRLDAMQALMLLTAAFLTLAGSAVAQPRGAKPIMVFHTHDFWLNLHQFLYVLGRHEAQSPDRTRRATANAPVDADQGLQSLSVEEQRLWRQAVNHYANGPSKQDAVFDQPLIAAGQALARAGDAPSLGGSGVDQQLAITLEQVAPIYRKAWWPAHSRANDEWADAVRVLVDKHGSAMLAFITRAYQRPWPPAGYPVRVSAYANWAGAFSTSGNLLIVSSLDPGLRGTAALEIAFHESMHQWDEDVDALLAAEAKKQNRDVPDLLFHALIFYTAGEATRSAVPGYVPYAEANGLWKQRGLGAFKQRLDDAWRPYLNGKGTRAEAITAMLTP